MIKPVQAVLRVLRNNIVYNETVVPVIKRGYPLDKTPCVTIDDSGGTAILEKHLTNMDYPLPETHPQYDPENPDEEYSQQVLMSKRRSTLNIHVWCNNEREREDLVNQVQLLFRKAESDYYLFCNNYDDGNCEKLDDECEAIDNINNRGIKGQCPHPTENDYQNIFTTYDIIRTTFDLEPAYSSDDLTTTQPVLRSIMRVTMAYYDYHLIGGNISTNLKYREIESDG